MWIRTIRSRVLGAGALRRKSKKNKAAPELEGAQTARPKGFDDFELRLGDTMRGERATIGKSLLDVQRDLKIKASYISAIENCDPGAFDTPGFCCRLCTILRKIPGHGQRRGSSTILCRKRLSNRKRAGTRVKRQKAAILSAPFTQAKQCGFN